MARAQSAALKSRSMAAMSWSQALGSRSVTVMSRSQALGSQSVAVRSQSQALRSRLAGNNAPAARRGHAGGRVFVSPATVRAQMMLTYRELAATARRQAIARARELGLLDG
jgi:hypothetical protein